jgi:hypothetical protein
MHEHQIRYIELMEKLNKIETKNDNLVKHSFIMIDNNFFYNSFLYVYFSLLSFFCMYLYLNFS